MKKILLVFMLVFSMNVFTAPQTEDGMLVQKMKQFGINQKSIDLYKEAKMLSFSSSKFEETILKAIKADPKNYYALDDLGIYYRQVKNNPEKAIEYYKKSIAVNPRNPFPYNSMGIAYTYMNDFVNAEKTFKQLIEAMPDHPEGYYGLTRVYLQQQEYNKAIDSAEKAKITYLNLDEKKYFEEAAMKKQYLLDCELLISFSNYGLKNYQKVVDNFFDVLPELRKTRPEIISDFAGVAYAANQEIKKTDTKKFEENNKKFEKEKIVFGN